MVDVRKGDRVIYRRTRLRARCEATVVKANRVNLACTAPYQLGAVGQGEVLTLTLSLPRADVDEVWRDGSKVFDSGRQAVGIGC